MMMRLSRRDGVLLSAVTLALLALVVLMVSTVAAPALAQPQNPPYAQFDIGPVAGNRKTAAWSARVENQVFRTVGPISYYKQSGIDGTNITIAPAGSFLMVGGSADVWISTNGFDWSIVAGPSTRSLGYIPNELANTFTFSYGQCFTKDRLTDKLYAIRDRLTYISADGGKTWTNSTAPGVGNRAWMFCTVDQNGTLYTVSGDRTDVSYDQGLTWTRRSTSPWGATWRTGHFGGRYFSTWLNKDLIYIMGGGRPAMNDVWVTSDGASTWVQLSANAAWPARYDTRLAITNEGILVVAGGRPDDSSTFNDVWTSLDGGYNWWLLRNHASFTPRGLPAITVDANGYLWVFGGAEFIYISNVPQFTPTNKIARSSHSFNQASMQQWAPLANRKLYHDQWGCVGLANWPGLGWQCAQPNDFNFESKTQSAPFSPRFNGHVRQILQPITYMGSDAQGQIVQKTAPAGSLVFYGGMKQDWTGTNDGWISVDTNAATWEPLFGAAAAAIGVSPDNYTVPQFNPGQAHCSKSTPSKTLFYSIGGDWNDIVYRSSDARIWTAVKSDFATVSYSLCGVADDWRVWHYGYDGFRYSTDEGVTWTYSIPVRQAPPARYVPFGGSYKSPANRLNTEVIFIMGGVIDNYNYNDVWFTLDYGLNWYMTTSAAAWPARTDAASFVDSRGVIVIMSGQAVNFRDWYNDMWTSLDGGYSWYELSSADAISTRVFPASTLRLDGRIVSIGGSREIGGYSNDVYLSEEGSHSLNQIRTWGPQVNKNMQGRVPRSEDCLGLTCLPNTTTCACGPLGSNGQPLPRADIQFVPNVRSAPWSPRFNMGLFRTTVSRNWKAMRQTTSGSYEQVALNGPANSWIMYGGGSNVADVWVSTNKGSTWETIAGLPGNPGIPNGFWDSFNNREGQGMCKDPMNDTLFIMGGKDPSSNAYTAWTREVWRATDGQDWIQMQDGTADGTTVWPGRAYFLCAVDLNGLLYSTGGNDDSYGLVDDDTYVSPDGGATWSMVQSTSSYPQRAAFFGGGHYGRFQGKTLIYAIGGASFRNFNDVWVTSDGARSWACLTATAPWSARADASMAFTDSGVMVLYGGQMRNFERFLSDVWMSLDGGYNWYVVAPYTTIEPRSYAGALIDEAGYLWIMGGNQMWTNVNAVYRSTVSFSDSAIPTWATSASIPGLVVPQANGLACWPGQACKYTPIPADYSGRNNQGNGGSTGVVCADPNSAAASSSNSLSGGAIAGIVIGVIVGAVIIAALLLALLRARGGKSGGTAGGSKFAPHEDVEMSQNNDGGDAEETA